jgi:hypothetical protein
MEGVLGEDHVDDVCTVHHVSRHYFIYQQLPQDF